MILINGIDINTPYPTMDKIQELFESEELSDVVTMFCEIIRNAQPKNYPPDKGFTHTFLTLVEQIIDDKNEIIDGDIISDWQIYPEVKPIDIIQEYRLWAKKRKKPKRLK